MNKGPSPIGRVVLYTQPGCGNCVKVKEFLRQREIVFEEKNVGRDREALLEMVEVHRSEITPTLLVGDQVTIGFSPEKLARALGLE